MQYNLYLVLTFHDLLYLSFQSCHFTDMRIVHVVVNTVNCESATFDSCNIIILKKDDFICMLYYGTERK